MYFPQKGAECKNMKKPHVHDFCNETTFDCGHSHRMRCTTGYDIPCGSSHVHPYNGVTTVDHAHVHSFSGTTGPAIPLSGGGHIHQYQGTTSFEHGHTHNYNSLTGNEKYSRLF